MIRNTWTLKWYVNLCSREILTKNARTAKCVCYLDSKNAQDFEKCSKRFWRCPNITCYPTNQQPALPWKKNTLWGIVKCWQAWSSQPNKGSKSPHAQNWKRADLKTHVVPFLICARLREFAPFLRLVCARSSLVFWKMLDLKWKMAPPNPLKISAAQSAFNKLPQGWYFCVQSDPATHECTRKTH